MPAFNGRGRADLSIASDARVSPKNCRLDMRYRSGLLTTLRDRCINQDRELFSLLADRYV